MRVKMMAQFIKVRLKCMGNFDFNFLIVKPGNVYEAVAGLGDMFCIIGIPSRARQGRSLKVRRTHYLKPMIFKEHESRQKSRWNNLSVGFSLFGSRKSRNNIFQETRHSTKVLVLKY